LAVANVPVCRLVHPRGVAAGNFGWITDKLEVIPDPDVGMWSTSSGSAEEVLHLLEAR
jgi:hypothetical protein